MAPELWTNACLVSIAKQGSDNVEFAAITDDIDIDPGMRDIIQINGVGGGCTTEHVPQTLGTMTINAFPLEIGTPSGTTGLGFWDLLQTADTAQALEIGNSKNRDKIRIALLWTDDTAVTSGSGAVSSSKNGIRIVFADAFVVDVKDKWSDGELTCSVTIKVTAFDSGDNATTPYNVLEQSTNATAAISALNAYTKSVKF